MAKLSMRMTSPIILRVQHMLHRIHDEMLEFKWEMLAVLNRGADKDSRVLSQALHRALKAI